MDENQIQQDNSSALSATEQKSDVKRETPEVSEGRKKLVANWVKEIQADKSHFDKDFKRMRKDMEYAKLGAEKSWVESDSYTVPIINRYVNQSVSRLYAKNPRFVSKRRPRLNYIYWDGRADTARAAMELFAMTQDPTAAAILEEIKNAQESEVMISRLGKTLEYLFSYFMSENDPNLKQQMKQWVRRARTTGVGYLTLGFQRAMERDPEIGGKIDDITAKISEMERLAADQVDGVAENEGKDMEQLRLDLEDLKQQEFIVVREGLVFDFPGSTDIIPHRKAKQLRGFVGADYITHEFKMAPEEIQRIWKVDVRNSYTKYTSQGDGENKSATNSATAGSENTPAEATVWKVQDKKNRQEFVLVEGYPDYVSPPAPPKQDVDGFWHTFVLTFNEVESEDSIFPLSDVHYLKHPQREYNNARQALREHRQANRPKYYAKKGVLEKEEKKLLESYQAHAVIELKGIDGKTPIENLIVPHKPVPIDPALYETRSIVNDVMFGVGAQEAQLGVTSNATATQSSIADQSSMSTTQSNVDDLDETLSDVARVGGQILLMEMSRPQVVEIVGPGAVWPELDRETISKDLYLEVKGGSSGRPNRAAELANMERAMPYFLQLGNVSPTVLGTKYAGLLDMDEEELIVEGLPSIVAMNAMATKMAAQPQPMPGGGKADPNQQGGQGSQNAEKPMANEPGPQAQFPGQTLNGMAQ